MILMLLVVTFTSIQFASWQAMASSDQDGDGLITSIEYLLNTQIQNWDSDGDSLPDGWEWKYGLNPLSATVGDDGQNNTGGYEIKVKSIADDFSSDIYTSGNVIVGTNNSQLA